MTQYFRMTGYSPENNFCFIIDTNGKFEKLWQLSAFCIKKGLKVIDISSDEKFLDVNIEKAQEDKEHFILRACADGKPDIIPYEFEGKTYNAIKIGDKIYIPDKDK